MNDPTTTGYTKAAHFRPHGSHHTVFAMAEGGHSKGLRRIWKCYGATFQASLQQMANVTGAGQTAYAQRSLGYGRRRRGTFDIAKEASSQRGALGDVFGLEVQMRHTQILPFAGTAPCKD